MSKGLLIADDSHDLTWRLREQLEESPEIPEIHVAHDGCEALRLFDLHAPSALLLDVQMPGLDGLQVLEAVRHRDPACLVILYTAMPGIELRQRALQSGANYFLSKTQDISSIESILRSHFGNAQ